MINNDTPLTGHGADDALSIIQPPSTMAVRASAAGTLLLALGLGLVLGAGALALATGALGTGALGNGAPGEFTEQAMGATLSSPASGTPGMELLNAYRCDKAEAKTIILGGREDGFASAESDPDTLPRPGDMRSVVANREGANGAVGVDRVYDGMELDNMLLDRFAIPRRTAHGIFVVRLDERSSKPNDTIGLGNLIDRIDIAHNWSARVSELDAVPGATVTRDGLPGKLVRMDLSAVDFPSRPTLQGEIKPQVHSDLMDFIRNGEGEAADVQLSVIDDTAVDFVGFALCEAPADHRGFTLFVEPVETDPELLHLSCDVETGEQCNPNAGDMLCSAELPLACFRRADDAVPASLTLEASRSWSGGEIDFTEAVAGSSFASREEAQALCRARFGDGWRVADYHDGRTYRSIIARGRADVSRAWVDARLQRYGSCWPRGDDYAEDAAGLFQ